MPTSTRRRGRPVPSTTKPLRTIRSKSLTAARTPPGSRLAPCVLDPRRHVDRRIRQLLHVAVGEETLVTLGIGRERPRVAHHDLEQLDALGPGDERAEGVALVE